MIGYGVLRDTSSRSRTDLNAVLGRAGRRPDTRDDVVFNLHLCSTPVRGDAILLVIMDTAVCNIYDGHSAARALDENRQAALAAIQTRAQFHVADGHALNVAGRVFVQNADESGPACRRATIRSVDDHIADMHVGGALDPDDRGSPSMALSSTLLGSITTPLSP